MYKKMSRHIYVMSKMLSMVPFHSLYHSSQNEVKHDFFGHAMPLVPELLSCDAYFTIFFSLRDENYTRCDINLLGM